MASGLFFRLWESLLDQVPSIISVLSKRDGHFQHVVFSMRGLIFLIDPSGVRHAVEVMSSEFTIATILDKSVAATKVRATWQGAPRIFGKERRGLNCTHTCLDAHGEKQQSRSHGGRQTLLILLVSILCSALTSCAPCLSFPSTFL